MVLEISLRCAAVLFDLDGVLVDSAACVEATWRRWASEHHLDPGAVIATAHGRRTIDTVRLVAPHLLAENEVAALGASESTTTAGIFEVPGARALVDHLPSAAWGIVTSGIQSVAAQRIQHTGLPMPRVLICADEVRVGKPDPEGYLAAAHRLGVAPEGCVVVEDAPAGLDAAAAAGMQSIGIAGTYRPEMLRAATYVLESLSRLRVQSAPRQLPIEFRFAPT